MKQKLKAREWGNSFGIVIPKEVVKKFNIHKDKTITVDFSSENPLRKTWELLPKRGLSGQKVKDMLRRELYNEEGT